MFLNHLHYFYQNVVMKRKCFFFLCTFNNVVFYVHQLISYVLQPVYGLWGFFSRTWDNKHNDCMIQYHRHSYMSTEMI